MFWAGLAQNWKRQEKGKYIFLSENINSYYNIPLRKKKLISLTLEKNPVCSKIIKTLFQLLQKTLHWTRPQILTC